MWAVHYCLSAGASSTEPLQPRLPRPCADALNRQWQSRTVRCESRDPPAAPTRQAEAALIAGNPGADQIGISVHQAAPSGRCPDELEGDAVSDATDDQVAARSRRRIRSALSRLRR